MTASEFYDLIKGLHKRPFTINSRIGVIDGEISIASDGRIYLCQNRISGSRTRNMLGYPYSWRIDAIYYEASKSVLINMFDNDHRYFYGDGTNYAYTLRIDGLDIYSAVTRKLTLYDLL